jgi:hypothetical protein
MIQAVELIGFFYRQNIAGFFNNTDHGAVSFGRRTDGAGITLGKVEALAAESHISFKIQ